MQALLEEVEQAGTVATDLALAAEQAAMQAMHDRRASARYSTTAHARVSNRPREWMARLCVSYKQVNKYVRAVVWRRVAELGLRGVHFKQIPNQVNADLVGDLLVVSNALAAPLANLFAFLAQGHPQCTFVDKAHLALCADLQFWQYGLLAFCSVCCACNINKLRRAAEAKADPAKQASYPTAEVNALTLMQTVIMSFARGMNHGEQEVPINDMYVYFPVQVLPSLVRSMTDNQFQPAKLDAGLGYRTTKDQLQDNPYLVVGAYRKTIEYAGNPMTCATSAHMRLHPCKKKSW